jgi:hypothetical protein
VNFGWGSAPWAIEVQAAATEKTRMAESSATALPFSTTFVFVIFT